MEADGWLETWPKKLKYNQSNWIGILTSLFSSWFDFERKNRPDKEESDTKTRLLFLETKWIPDEKNYFYCQHKECCWLGTMVEHGNKYSIVFRERAKKVM